MFFEVLFSFIFYARAIKPVLTIESFVFVFLFSWSWFVFVFLVLSTALGLRPRAVLKTAGTVFPYTDLPAGK